MIQLIKGECLEAMKQIPTGSVDAIITDPPYGTTRCKWDSVIDFELMWEQLNRIIKPNGAIVLFGSEPFSSALRMSNIKNYKYDWVWEKSKATNFLNAKKQPLRAKESILVFYKKQPTYNPQMTKGKSYNKGIRKKQTKDDVYGSFNQTEVKSEGNRYPRDVLYFKTAETEGETFHKTQKPVKLMEYLIKTYTNENEIVLDFTMGSGTTGVAAKNLNRSFIGIELDDKYFEIAQQRICDTKRVYDLH
jgi:DNA modification methylase